MATLPIIAALGQAIFKLLLSAMAIFLILLVLVQRGRGGGLAGALGGMGGSSAFGAKAGDVFTRVTVIAAAIWIILCIIAANVAPSSESRINTGSSVPVSSGLGSGPAMTGPVSEEGESAADVDTEATADSDATAGEETASGDASSGDEVSE